MYFPGGTNGKEPACQCRRRKRQGFNPGGQEDPLEEGMATQQPTSVFLPGESHGQRSLAGYSPQGPKESNMTEVTEHALMHKPYIFCMPHFLCVEN